MAHTSAEIIQLFPKVRSPAGFEPKRTRRPPAALKRIKALASSAGDAALIEAECEIKRIYALAATMPGNTSREENARDAVFTQAWDIEDWLRTALPVSMIGVAVKLRLLSRSISELGVVDDENDATCVQQCLVIINREIAANHRPS